MYWISGVLKRKLIGTPTLPYALLPNKKTRSLAALCETIATRAPVSSPNSSNPAAIPLESSASRL